MLFLPVSCYRRPKKNKKPPGRVSDSGVLAVHLFQLEEQHGHRDHNGTAVGDGGGPEYAYQPPKPGTNQNRRNQEEHLTGQTEENGDVRLTDGLEKLGGDNLKTDQRKHEEYPENPHPGNTYQFRIGSKDTCHGFREEHGGQKCHSGNDASGPQGEGKDFPDSFPMSGPVIVAGNGLHSLAEADHQHDKEHGVGIGDSECSDGQIASVFHQLVVHQNIDDAGGQIDEERGQPDGKDVTDDKGINPDVFLAETNGGILVGEKTKGDKGTDGHGYHTGPGRSLYAPIEQERPWKPPATLRIGRVSRRWSNRR